MTLIAAFKAHGVPVLIGDFLITGDGTQTELRKKVLLVANNFVLAWTGHLFAAESVVKSLQSSLDPSATTLDSIRSVLTNPETAELGELHVTVIGWVVDAQGQHCFRWNSGYPGELFFDTAMYDGTGESIVRKLAGPAGLSYSTTTDAIDPEGAVTGALSIVTKLMRAELEGPSTRPLGFGFAYEIVILTEGSRFEYIQSVLYVAITHELDEHGKFVGSNFFGPVFKYEARDNYTVVHVLEPNRNSHSIHVIQPVGYHSLETAENLGKQVMARDRYFPFRSDFYCAFVRLVAPGFESPVLTMTQPDSIPDKHRIFGASEDGALELRISSDVVEWQFNMVRADRGA